MNTNALTQHNHKKKRIIMEKKTKKKIKMKLMFDSCPLQYFKNSFFPTIVLITTYCCHYTVY